MKQGIAVAGFVVVALVVGTCVACADDDEDATRGPSEAAAAVYGDRGDKGGRDCNDVDEGATCEDNDLSPSFDKSPVQDSFNPEITVCLPGSTCNGGNPE